MYTIDDFWIPSLRCTGDYNLTREMPVGWSTRADQLDTFVEAPLEAAGGFGGGAAAPICLVSAPGAVGKSTLAREIAARTGAVLIDLARANAVGSASVTGGLAWAGIFNDFLDGSVSLLIDGIDEARIRVTKDSFEAFLEDICKLAESNSKPIILFGRTAAVENAWLYFAEQDVEPLVLEIKFHERTSALEFVTRQVNSFRKKQSQNAHAFADADSRAADLILARLTDYAQSDGTKFAGYAPVLIAVARRIATENNPMNLIQALAEGADVLSLNHIVDAILEREQAKLDRLEFTDPWLKEKLYQKAEQVDRLISTIYDIAHDPKLPEMNQNDSTTYREALDNWVPDHPFTDGSGTHPSSEVFEGFIIAEALKRDWAREFVRSAELESVKANPFTWQFRLPDRWRDVNEWDSSEMVDSPEGDPIPLADLGLVLVSLQAQLPRSGSAVLFVDAEVDGDDLETGAEVEFELHVDDTARWIRLSSENKGTIRFGSLISGAYIFGNQLRVVVSGNETTFAAPVHLNVRRIDAGYSDIVVERPTGHDTTGIPAKVSLQCEVFNWVNTALSVRPNVELAVNWPGSESYPWHNYQMPDAPEAFNAEFYERHRRLRNILVLFRSGGKGQLAKYKGAIDAERRTRGSGAAIRDLLLEEGVLREEGRVYILDTDRLHQVLGLSYQEIREAVVNRQTIEFLSRVIP